MKKYHWFALVLLCISLQGCVLLAAGAGAATGAVVVHDRRSMQTMADDQNIEFTASSQINHNKAFDNKDTHVVVVSYNHVVLITGQVPDQGTRDQVQALVQALPKVSRVYNELAIAPPTSPLTRSSDTWITTKVKAQMVGTAGLSSSQIKVVTEDSTVFLMGVVTRKQSDLAINVARQVVGVKKVVTLFEYTYQ